MQFLTWWQDQAAAAGHRGISDAVLNEARAVFKRCDLNENGTIEIDEMSELLKLLKLIQYLPDAFVERSSPEFQAEAEGKPAVTIAEETDRLLRSIQTGTGGTAIDAIAADIQGAIDAVALELPFAGDSGLAFAAAPAHGPMRCQKAE